jgi:hypothetical protein
MARRHILSQVQRLLAPRVRGIQPAPEQRAERPQSRGGGIVAGGGTPFGPNLIPFNAPNLAQCNNAAALTCTASAQAFLTYLNYSPNKLNRFSLRAEWYDDMEGQRTGVKTRYVDVAGSWQHWLSPQIEMRPEIAYYRSLDADAYGNVNAGIAPNRNYAVIGAADLIVHF